MYKISIVICKQSRARLESVRSWGRIKRKTIKLVFVASLQSIHSTEEQEQEQRLVGIAVLIMCPSGATWCLWTVITMSWHYTNPTKRVGLV